jgi:FkbM family methyltransferase
MTILADRSLNALKVAARPIRKSYYALRRALLGRVPKWRLVGGRFYMHIDPDDVMDRAYYFGTYERHLIHLISMMVQRNDVCIDAGAQKGFITLHMAHAVGPRGRVLAFEPDPRAAQQLTAHVQHNGLQHVDVHPYALGDREASCSFSLSRQLGWSSRFPNKLAEPTVTATISIESRPLDEVLRDVFLSESTPPLSFIKLDVEGSEPLVLQGAKETLQRFRPALHMEVNKGSLSTAGFTAAFMEDLLRGLGYRLYGIRLQSRAWRRPRLSLVSLQSLDGEGSDCRDILALHTASRYRSAYTYAANEM